MTLDAGALIALERDDRKVWAALKLAALRGRDVAVPTTALAQVWRGSPRQAWLSRALAYCTDAAFDSRAREVGELCAATDTSDVCDAHVALVASARGGALYTSDASDLSVLLRAARGRSVTIVPC